MHVINPALIYFSEVADYLKSMSIVAFLISLVSSVIIVAFGLGNIFGNMEYGPDDRDYKKGKIALNMSKKFIIPLIVTFILTITIPSKETVYKMIIANFITYKNVDLTTETIEEAFDHVIDKFKELKGGITWKIHLRKYILINIVSLANSLILLKRKIHVIFVWQIR